MYAPHKGYNIANEVNSLKFITCDIVTLKIHTVQSTRFAYRFFNGIFVLFVMHPGGFSRFPVDTVVNFRT